LTVDERERICCGRAQALADQMHRFLLLRSSWSQHLRDEALEAIHWQAQRVQSAATPRQAPHAAGAGRLRGPVRASETSRASLLVTSGARPGAMG